MTAPDHPARAQAESIELLAEVAAWRECAAAQHAYRYLRARVGSQEEMLAAQRLEAAFRACRPYVDAATGVVPKSKS
ncbi:hypothetical protein [Cupriavidus basilensis]|uniref:hypothetical protein n=1 Tax=Cupriavidus basilensis TaxID=68895 RepID=UPI000750C358|nr:hypothetical protein [Cupriavidus basilensis]